VCVCASTPVLPGSARTSTATGGKTGISVESRTCAVFLENMRMTSLHRFVDREKIF